MGKLDNLIPINITKAKVRQIALKFGEKKFEYSASVDLIDQHGKSITYIQVGNDNWNDENNADLPLTVVDLAKKVRAEIEVVIIRHMNKQQNLIEGKGKEVK